MNPALIRCALEHSDSHDHRSTAARFGVSTRTVTRWRAQRAAAAAAGQQWPTEADVTYWTAQQPDRAMRRARQTRWMRRRVLTGRPLLIDSIGTTRRLRALTAIGWRLTDLAAELGVAPTRVAALRTGRRPTVHQDTAAIVAALYDRRSMTRGPSAKAAALAAAAGWPPPLAWDDHEIDDPAARPRLGRSRRGEKAFDEVAVQRAAHGDPVRLRPVELAAAVRKLTAAGHSATDIAARLGTTSRSVQRHRSADPTRRTA